MIKISTDEGKLDIEVIHSFLSNSYWGKGRTKEEVKVTIENSLNFGVYLHGEQIGYARITTDYVVFAYLMDVFILPKYRGKGYSKKLLKAIIDFPELSNVKTWLLMTKDAHGLYTQFGFAELKHPEKVLERIIER